MRNLSYLYLALAVVLELTATSLLKLTEGFTRLGMTALCLALYFGCYFFMSRALQQLNLGIAYAVWCGVGLVVSSLVSVFAYHQHLSPVAMFAIGLILVGCVLLNLFG